MTVYELIAELQKFDGNLDVVIGLDDYEEATDVAAVAPMVWVRKPGYRKGIIYECREDCDDEPVPVVMIDPRR